MTALAPQAQTDRVRDHSYYRTALGPRILEFLNWQEVGGYAPKTIYQSELDLSKGAMLLPDKGINDLTDADALKIATIYKPGERASRVGTWNTFYDKWAKKQRHLEVERNPFDSLPALKRQTRKIIDVFGEAEVAALTNLPLRDGALMQILFDCGLRKGEMRKLKLLHYRPQIIPDPDDSEQFIEIGGELAILNSKFNKDRLVPTTLVVRQKLNQLALEDGLNATDYLWYLRHGGGPRIRRSSEMGDGSAQEWWKRCVKAAGVRYRNLHTTRHTFATRWLRRGGRITTLSTVMGHASIATTYDLYGHLETRDIEQDLALIEAWGNQS